MSATDRDRVEAACRAYWGDGLRARLDWRREAMSRALAAADALAPPPEIERLTRERDDRDRAAQTWMEAFHEQSARAEAAERERDEARKLGSDLAVQAAHEQAGRRAVKARLARVRADALEEAARLFDDRSVPIAQQIRALADSEPAGRAALAAEGPPGEPLP